jgi:hypothetical protein
MYAVFSVKYIALSEEIKVMLQGGLKYILVQEPVL